METFMLFLNHDLETSLSLPPSFPPLSFGSASSLLSLFWSKKCLPAAPGLNSQPKRSFFLSESSIKSPRKTLSYQSQITCCSQRWIINHVGWEQEGMIAKGRLRAAAKGRGMDAGQRGKHTMCTTIRRASYQGINKMSGFIHHLPSFSCHHFIKISHTLKEWLRLSHNIGGGIIC